MEKQELLKKVKEVVARVLKMDPEEIADDANFVFDLGADSMQSIQLVAAFEEEFGITMDQDKALTVQTVNAAADFIENYLKK
ncbi:MAG: acyl carrier protein [Bacteroidales bacterium]|nr:acyl carrier protein [Bacteroidales bacterium]HQH40761.1 acyl carrier protein [Bacteroidales bacterium]HQK35996.1 acyl carrier protein [Bacteroidales bacterium]